VTPIDIASYWRIRPPLSEPGDSDSPNDVPVIRIAPGTAFGDGRHETTQLCLQALGFLARRGFRPASALDFGAGSGILSIAAAQLGAQVEAIEIDQRALASVRHNARLNGTQDRIVARTHLSDPPLRYDVVLANVIPGVLLSSAEALGQRQSREGWMILSGLLATDAPAILATYAPLLRPMRPTIYERGEWRAILFSPGP
jgi:ribosomal protein L11 methyltransferase